MPSLFEPCGLSQMMSLKYGTIPIVRETGGLADSVQPYNEFEQTGTGFSFSNYNAHEMMDTIDYALHTFYDYPDAWDAIVQRAMVQNNTFVYLRHYFKNRGVSLGGTSFIILKSIDNKGII